MMQRIISFVLSLSASVAAMSAAQSEPADSLVRELQEVVVSAAQPATRLVGTTLVSTIAGSNLQDLGTAIDVLAQLPMITVTDNAVSVVGKGVVEIFIDGRPMRSDDELMQLRSDNIRKVELDMAPGAMYASDTEAVLRISTRHNFVNGLSFTDRGEATFRRKISADNMLDVNYRTGAWDIFGSGMIARRNNLIKGSTTNTLIYDGEETVVGSSQQKEYPVTDGMAKIGVNYSSGKQSFGGYYRYSGDSGDFSNIGDEWLNSEPHVGRDIYRAAHTRSHRVSLYYDDMFGGRYRLHFDGDYHGSRSANDMLTTYPDHTMADVHSSDTRRSSLWAGKLYLSFPLLKGEFTIGTQDSYTRTSLDYLMHTADISEYIPSSDTEARQASAAAFASWSRMFGQFSLSAGMRYEYVDYLLTVNGIRDDGMSRTDNHLTPDVSLGYQFNDDVQISLSYKMATIKPPYAQLTGSLSYVGIHEIEGGNPALKDERMHNARLFGRWKDFIVQADYTRSIDTYAFVKRVYPASSLQLLLQPVNVDVSALDIFLVWSTPVKAWTPGMTFGMHRQWLSLNGDSYDRPIFSYYLDNMIALPHGFDVTVNAHGQSQGDMHTNRFGASWFTLDVSVSKSFFNRALQLKLSATDIFNSRNNDWTMSTCGVFVDKRQTYDRRGISVSLTYSFQPRKSAYKGREASEDEMNRL